MHVYNRWANGRVLEAMTGLTAEDLATAAPVAFGTLRGALWHVIGAQMGWLRICSGQDTWSRAQVRDAESIEGLGEVLTDVGRDVGGVHRIPSRGGCAGAGRSANRRAVPDSLLGPDLLKWTDTHGHRPRRPMWQSVLHVVNHGTQHRAEIGMYLASIGRSPDDMDYGTFEEYRAIYDDAEDLGAIR